jgi:hypothetical protein
MHIVETGPIGVMMINPAAMMSASVAMCIRPRTPASRCA